MRLQGLPFYAVDSAPHCQACYLGTLERCCKCHQPILDRILRATGGSHVARLMVTLL